MSQTPSPLASAPPPFYFKRKKFMPVKYVILIFVCVTFAFASGILFIIRNSEPVRLVFVQVRRDPVVIQNLGRPIHRGFFITGNIQYGPSGHAELSIPIRGPKGRGEIYATGDRRMGRWEFNAIELEIKGQDERINLLPAPANPAHGDH